MRKKYWAVGALMLMTTMMTILLIAISRKQWRDARGVANHHYEDYD